MSATESPLVSIVIPVYNGADYLRDAIESALAQTYSPVEVIVVNDGSQDGGATERVAASFQGRIRYFAKENGHVASALNLGIREMRGVYFSWLSHDDLYLPDKLALQVPHAERLGRRSIIYSDFRVLDVEKGTTADVVMKAVDPDRFRWHITLDNSLNGCTLLIPKACFDECGLFDESLRTTQDYDMWFRLAGKFPFTYVPRTVMVSRQHPGQGTRTLRGIALEECNRLLSRFIAHFSREELRAVSGMSPARAYAYIRRNMEQRGFYGASDTARERLEEELRQSSPLTAALVRAELGMRSLCARVGALLRGLARRVEAVLPRGSGT